MPPVRNFRFVLRAAVRFDETVNVLFVVLTEVMTARVGTPVPATNKPGTRPRPVMVSPPPRVIVVWPEAPVGAVKVAPATLPPERTTSPPRMLNHWPLARPKVWGLVRLSVPLPNLTTASRVAAPEPAVIGLLSTIVPPKSALKPRVRAVVILEMPPAMRKVLPERAPSDAWKA